MSAFGFLKAFEQIRKAVCPHLEQSYDSLMLLKDILTDFNANLVKETLKRHDSYSVTYKSAQIAVTRLLNRSALRDLLILAGMKSVFLFEREINLHNEEEEESESNSNENEKLQFSGVSNLVPDPNATCVATSSHVTTEASRKMTSTETSPGSKKACKTAKKAKDSPSLDQQNQGDVSEPVSQVMPKREVRKKRTRRIPKQRNEHEDSISSNKQSQTVHESLCKSCSDKIDSTQNLKENERRKTKPGAVADIQITGNSNSSMRDKHRPNNSSIQNSNSKELLSNSSSSSFEDSKMSSQEATSWEENRALYISQVSMGQVTPPTNSPRNIDCCPILERLSPVIIPSTKKLKQVDFSDAVTNMINNAHGLLPLTEQGQKYLIRILQTVCHSLALKSIKQCSSDTLVEEHISLTIKSTFPKAMGYMAMKAGYKIVYHVSDIDTVLDNTTSGKQLGEQLASQQVDNYKDTITRKMSFSTIVTAASFIMKNLFSGVNAENENNSMHELVEEAMNVQQEKSESE